MQTLLLVMAVGLGGVAVGLQGPLTSLMSQWRGTFKHHFINHLGRAIPVAVCSLLALAGCARQSFQAPSPTGSPDAGALLTPTPLASTPGPSMTAPLPTATPRPSSTPPTWPTLAGKDVLPAPLYFVSYTAVTRIERDGKTRTSVAKPAGEQVKGFDVSPADGSVVLATLGRLWLARAGQEEPEVLITGLPDPEATDGIYAIGDPVWSPDGKQIAYVDGGARVLDVASGRRIDLAELPTFGDAEFGIPWRFRADSYREPRWSPRGDAILFERQTADYHTLMLVTLRDKRVQEVPGTLGVGQEDAAWSPDGEALLFDYWWPANVAEIPIEEPSLLRLTLADLRARVLWPHGDRADPVFTSAGNNPRQAIYPLQTPDGRLLYFQAEPCDTGSCFNYSLMEGTITPDKFEARVLHRNALPKGMDDMAWHESGKYIAFVIDQGETYFIAVLRVDTGEMFTLLEEEDRPLYIRWGKQ